MKKKNSAWFWVVLLVVIFLIGLVYLKTKGKISNFEDLSDSSNIQQDNLAGHPNSIIEKDCPEEMDKEHVYIIHNKYTGEFPIDTRVYSNKSFDGMGNINSYCRRASQTGENSNYLYCDSSSYGLYTREREVDDNGILQEVRMWKIKIVADLESCEYQGDEEVSHMTILPVYKCKIVEADCDEI